MSSQLGVAEAEKEMHQVTEFIHEAVGWLKFGRMLVRMSMPVAERASRNEVETGGQAGLQRGPRGGRADKEYRRYGKMSSKSNAKWVHAARSERLSPIQLIDQWG